MSPPRQRERETYDRLDPSHDEDQDSNELKGAVGVGLDRLEQGSERINSSGRAGKRHDAAEIVRFSDR